MELRKLNVAYTTYKQLVGTIPTYYVQQGDGGYTLFAAGELAFIQCDLLGSDASVADFEASVKSRCSSVASPDDAYVLGLVANRVPLVVKRAPDGRQRMSQEKPTVSRTTFYTHNWCDKTTWYTDSVLVVTESVSFVSGAYQLAHTNVIDTYHGKLTGEDFLRDAAGSSYRVHVYASGSLKTEQDPHYAAGGDYVINYANGVITPISGQLADPVTVTYHYATTSYFYLTPASGKNLVISQAEVQFSKDVGVTDSISFQAQGKVEYWAPRLTGSIPVGTYIPLGNAVRYKTMMDYLNESQRSYPYYPAFGGDSWRAMSQDSIIMDWDYVSAQTIYSATGMRVRIGLDHHEPFTGTFGTATFYCISEDA
jgi:hypothetical protein